MTPPTAHTVPPGTENAATQVVIGAGGVVAWAALTMAALKVDDTFEATGSVLLVALGAVLLTLGGLTLNAGIQRLRARRTALRSGRPYWAGVCIDTDQRLLQRVMLIDVDGVRLLTMSGRQLFAWPWSTIEQAAAGGVTVSERSTSGLLLRTVGKSHTFAFSSRWGIGNSEYQAVAAELAITTGKREHPDVVQP